MTRRLAKPRFKPCIRVSRTRLPIAGERAICPRPTIRGSRVGVRAGGRSGSSSNPGRRAWSAGGRCTKRIRAERSLGPALRRRRGTYESDSLRSRCAGSSSPPCSPPAPTRASRRVPPTTPEPTPLRRATWPTAQHRAWRPRRAALADASMCPRTRPIVALAASRADRGSPAARARAAPTAR